MDYVRAGDQQTARIPIGSHPFMRTFADLSTQTVLDFRQQESALTGSA
jgi:hypothetical protein